MTPNEIHAKLKNLEFVHKLPSEVGDEVISIFEDISELRMVPKGGIWIRENEPSENKGFVLLVGSVLVHKAGVPDFEVQAPELIGEMMQFNPNHIRTATVSAAEDIALARFYWHDFWAAVDDRIPKQKEVIQDALKTVAWEHLAG